MEFHLTRRAREKFKFDHSPYLPNGGLKFADLKFVRDFAHQINQQNEFVVQPEKRIKTSQLNGVGLINEIFNHIFNLYQKEKNPAALQILSSTMQKEPGADNLEALSGQYLLFYPPLEVYQNKTSAADFLSDRSDNFSHREMVLKSLIFLWISTQNPALEPFSNLIWEPDLLQNDLFKPVMKQVENVFANMPAFGPENQSIIEMLKSPARHCPNSITGQLEYIREHWGFLLGDILNKLLTGLDLAKEEEKLGFVGPGPVMIPTYAEKESYISSDQKNGLQAFSKDRDWMPRLVLMAKNIFVWLDQLSKKYNRSITRLDQIPDAELEDLQKIGITGLWLIGLWQRSPASARIKQLCGNPEAVSSAYSLYNYQIAEVLGGEEACDRLKEKAASFGIRLASDMVPNHMGIDSEWVIQHPEWFLSVDECPFPSYTFNGPDLSSDASIAIQIEDHYFDRSDAAVVFRRIDKRNGQTKFIYHGNDGTSMPWNDTAQLNYLDPAVREVVIQTILEVARKFPIIRFDAAMTLAKKHVQRLWFPEPGSGGAIPSRSEFSISKAEFDRAIPKEFWREVVERIEAEVPDTLLLAEAFWQMEGYFVRTLGMHRVYNSAFMHMLRNEDNAGYRKLMKNTLEYEPEILKRFVNFMNNPDERTAVDQFGSGDKYFGICTLMTTMPGLPMFGHGQIQGFTEKYGMEYSRAFYNEKEDQALIDRHNAEIIPLLYQRELFAEVDHFYLFDFFLNNGQVDENVYAYTNQRDERKTLIFYNNSYQETEGRIRESVTSSIGRKPKSISSVLGLRKNGQGYLQFHDLTSGLDFIYPVHQLNTSGFEIHLNGYEHHVFVDFKLVHSDAAHDYDLLFNRYGRGGIPDLKQAFYEIQIQPILKPLQELINADYLNTLREASSLSTELNPNLAASMKVKINALLTGISQRHKTRENRLELQDEIVRLSNALFQLPQLERFYAVPGTKNIERVLASLTRGICQNKMRWNTLAVWSLISLVGKISPTGNPVATTLDWMENWGLKQTIDTLCRQQGLSADESQASYALIALMVAQQNWYRENKNKSARDILSCWFSSPDAQVFLKFNRFDNKLWYDQKAFDELLWGMEIIPILQAQSDRKANRVSVAEAILQLEHLFSQIRESDGKSACQVEQLISFAEK